MSGPEFAAKLFEQIEAVRTDYLALQDRIRLALKLALGAFALLIAANVAIWAALSNKTDASETARVVERTNGALCAFVGDLEQRVIGAETFLREHPHGFAGISVASIKVNVANQRRTIEALSSLGCER